MTTVKEEFEFCDKSGTHSITSSNILCCSDTGRVVAVFYNERDLMAATGLIKKVELIDGKAYQFDYKGSAIDGTYDSNGNVMWAKGSPRHISNCTNIQLLEVKS